MLLGSSRLRTLLAALLVHAGDVASVDMLAEALWGDRSPADPRNAIQTYVARLRDALGDMATLVTRSPGYVLEVDPEQVDALRFEQLLREARRRAGRPDDVRKLLDEGLGLWRGPAYAEFSDGVARADALRLDEQRLAATEERAAARLALGEAADVVGELGALTVAHPLRERFVELLMQSLAAVDRQADALAAYRGYRSRLAEETGLEPSPSIRNLESGILRGESGRTAPPPPKAPALAASGGKAPGPPLVSTSLVGRKREIAAARAALGRHRILTLIGSGGVGKTRVAAEVARVIHGEADLEVTWVELAPLADPHAVEHVAAVALGVDLAGRTPRDAVLDALAARSWLLILDNCEHLLDAVAALVDQVLRRCPHVRVLATSRERLALDGEAVMPVAPLPVDQGADGAGTDGAAQLFLDRAADAAPNLDLSGQRSVVDAICRQLDGLPLAIELAAARTGALSVQDLLTALQDDVSRAVGQRRSEPERHRDLWAVVDWSYRMLEEGPQQLLERLSVFAGTFGIEEVQAVCAPTGASRAATTAHLATLAERSLLVGPLGQADGGKSRYRMLRTLRAFARQRLADRGESSAVADRHTQILTARAEAAAGPPLVDDGWNWLVVALADLREVRRRAQRTGDLDILGRIVAAVFWLDYWRAGSELIGWADDALTVESAAAHPQAPQLHAAAATGAWVRGDLARARSVAERGAALGAGPDDPTRTTAFLALGDVANFEGRLGDAEAAFHEMVRLARLGCDPDGEATGLASAAIVVAYAGRTDEAVAEAEAAVRAAARAGPAAWAFARYAQGECRAETAPEQAIELVEEAAALARDCGASFVEGVAGLTAASLRGRHGPPAEAIAAFVNLLRRWRRSSNWTQQWTTLRNLAELLVRLHVEEPAVVISAAAAAERTAAPTFGKEFHRLADAIATARARLGTERFEAARRHGEQLPRQEVVDLAIATVQAVPTG